VHRVTLRAVHIVMCVVASKLVMAMLTAIVVMCTMMVAIVSEMLMSVTVVLISVASAEFDGDAVNLRLTGRDNERSRHEQHREQLSG